MALQHGRTIRRILAAGAALIAGPAVAADVPPYSAGASLIGTPLGDGRFITTSPGSYASAGSSTRIGFDENRVEMVSHAQGIPFDIDPVTGMTRYSGAEAAAFLSFYAIVDGPADATTFSLLFDFTMTGGSTAGGFYRVNASAVNLDSPYDVTYTAALDGSTAFPPPTRLTGAVGGSLVHAGDVVAFLLVTSALASPDGPCCFGFPGPITNRFVRSDAAITGTVRIDPAYAAVDPDYATKFRIRLSPGIGPGAVPEPATWMTLLTGFAIVGLTPRRRRGLLPAEARN